MKATLKPLKGKYYGTIIEIDFKDGGEKSTINLWDSGDYEPSIRELKANGLTQEQWDNNELVNNGWGGECNARQLDIVCDSHFESKLTYERAIKLIEAIKLYDNPLANPNNPL